MELTDEQLVDAFERTTLPANRFDHASHVRVAWWYLRHHALGAALDRFSTALRRFADAHGAAGKYHETMTVIYVLAIAERLFEAPDLGWPAFAGRYPELFERAPTLVERYYTPAQLASVRARNGFVMPASRLPCRAPDAP